jgi:glucokinase
MNVLGIDIGAGTIKSAVFSASGQTLVSAEAETARDYPALKAQLLAIMASLGKPHGVGAVGIGVPGFIAAGDGTIVRSPNMRFLDGIALQKELADATDLRVLVENDANAAALGEFLALAAPVPAPQGDGGNPVRPASFVHLTLGSGIGSGIILNGRIWRGAGGFAAELGHLLVNSQGRDCGCGNRGCAETESSEAGIVQSYQEFVGSPYPLRSRDVFDRLQRGDEAACRAFRRAGVFLGVLLAQIVYALNPELISIGGGVAACGDALLGPAREELARRVVARACAGTTIAPARLGNDAGKAGAAALARQETT